MMSRLFFFFVFLRAHVRIAAFVVLSALLIGVYWPSLYHIARGDQISYFAEVSARQGFAGVVLQTLDLNRTRSFSPGDQFLFEPVLFLILGLEKYFFGYNFFWWQAFGVAAHLFAVGALYALLCRIRGGLFAFVASAFFAFLLTNVEAVTWNHITAYVVFAGCTLMALRNICAAEMDRAAALKYVPAALAWTAVGMFIYITGVWYAIVFGLLFWRRGLRSAAWGFFALSAAWFLLNSVDLAWRGCASAFGYYTAHFGVWNTLSNMVFLAKWCLSMALFLSPADLIVVSRMMIRPELLGVLWPFGHPLTFAVGAGAACVIMALIWLVWDRPWRGIVRAQAGMIVVCAAMAAGYLFVIAAGRINSQGVMDVLRVTLYYPYNFLPLIIILIALLWRGGARGIAGRVLRYLVLVVLAGIIMFNAYSAWQVNRQMARDHAATRIFLTALDQYVRAHEKEPGFSFHVAPGYPGNYTASWVTRDGDPPGRQYTVAEVMYRRYYTAEKPKHVIR